MTRHTGRRGFTLIQLLLILAIIAILLGFLLPALAHLRRSAGATYSANHMRHLGLAVHNYHDTYQKLPPIVGTLNNKPAPGQPDGTLHYHLLPYLEQEQLFRKADGGVWKNGVNGTVVPSYIDRNDASAPPGNVFKGWLATTNYPGNWLFFGRGDQTLIGATDGTSNTLMFTQRYQMCKGHPTAWGYPGLYYWSPMFGYYTQGRFQHMPTQEDCDPALPQSLESSGIHVGMADGSTRILSPSLSPHTWWLATDPRDGNPLPEEFQQ